MLIGVKPTENVAVSAFKEAEPACKRDNPEILIFCNRSESVNKLYLNNMCFSLNDFFFGININNKAQEEAENQNRRPDETVNSDIKEIIRSRYRFAEQGNDCAGNGRCKRVCNGSD